MARNKDPFHFPPDGWCETRIRETQTVINNCGFNGSEADQILILRMRLDDAEDLAEYRLKRLLALEKYIHAMWTENNWKGYEAPPNAENPYASD